MIRFGFFTDLHLSGQTPRHRTDDFPRSLLEKLRESYSTARVEGCSFMAFGGDFFNTHRVYSYEVIGDAMDIVCESGLPTYACIGEHDLYGHSPKTFPTSTLSFFIRRCPSFHIVMEPLEVETGLFIHAKHEWEPVDAIRGKDRIVDTRKFNLLLCHELITNGNAPFEITHTDTLKDSPFDLVMSGDLHDGYNPHCSGKTWFCNPGSMARQKTNEADRHPTIAIVEVEKGLDPVFDLRKLACAKPGKDVFGESLMEMLKETDSFGEDFTQEMMKFEMEAVDIHELIQTVGKTNGLRKAVLDYLATKRVEQT